MNKILTNFGIVVLLLVVTIGSYLLARGTTTKVIESVKIPNREFAVEMKSNFIEGCVADGGYEFCLCAYEDLEKSIGEKGIMEMAVAFEGTDNPKLPPEALESVSNCLNKLK